MGEATKIVELEHLILHAGGDMALARAKVRDLNRTVVDAMAGEGASTSQIVALGRLFLALDSSLARIETTLKLGQCACAEHPVAFVEADPVEQAPNVLPFRRFALARKTPGVA